ncbi:uncharacterized protein LOC141798057 isoform X2 [Halichoeres trimaculatus]|uniref:uncharacterized protein LOC141798057 isoform X2 n=1 Tax=Halichoeres trimaculatus TaxID=147232 RepID=UPI003D9E8E9A
MHGSRLAFLLALCLKCVSSNDQTGCENSGVCKISKLSASLGSSVLLPCNLSTSNNTSVTWTQTSKRDLVSLTSDGHVQFTDPRYGRVKAFPNQGSKGNFSIRIDELKDSDLGCYFCKWEKDCCQVDLDAEKGTLSENVRLLIYACVGVGVLIQGCVGGYFCMKHTRSRDKTSRDNAFNSAEADGATAPPAGQGRVHFQQQRENDDHDPANQQGDSSRSQCAPPAHLQEAARTQPSGSHPNSSQFKFVRMERQSTKLRFHRELFDRLRQASFSRHYYVNHGEINNQDATVAAHFKKGVGRGRAKENCDYKNPIYNRSTDRLDQM